MLKDFQIEQLIIVKKILDRYEEEDSMFSRMVAGFKYYLGIPDYSVSSAAHIIYKYILSKDQKDLQNPDLTYIKIFLQSYVNVEKKYHSKCSVTKYKCKGFDDVVREICQTKSLDCILYADLTCAQSEP